jgi:uncharacterized repeat protein (TIGR03803 family)
MTSQRSLAVSIRSILGVACLVLATQFVQAQTFTVLYTFTGAHGDGLFPEAGLVQDAAGNFYGTTSGGGVMTKCGKCGTVYKIDTAGNETVLHSFGAIGDGATPSAGLVQDAAGNLYGTTTSGGASNFGTVFKVDTAGKETVLYSFAGGSDGEDPIGGLILDAAGNLYGTTWSGGTFPACYGIGCGTVFMLDVTGKETVLHSFGGGGDGTNPTAGLVQDPSGNLYGTTESGGALNLGTVFKVDTTGAETVLYSFLGGEDGAYPYADLVRDAEGNLYGTTLYGGGSQGCPANTCGTVFKVDTAGVESVVHAFNGADGWNPLGGLIRDTTGNLYGTTKQGGGGDDDGTVFEVDKTGTETVLYGFSGGSRTDPGGPFGALVLDAAGNLYSTTYSGGAFDGGIVFKLAPSHLKTTTTTTLTSSPNPSLQGQPITFTATVTSSGGPPPNGESVTFYDGVSILGTGSLSAGVASLTTSSLPLGTFTITATYAGDANFAASTSPALRQVVNAAVKSATSTTISSSLNPSIQGQPVTFTATVTSSGGTPPNGETVTFYTGINVLGTAPMTGGIASLTTSGMGSGIHAISAAYLGDGNFIGSTSPALGQAVDTSAQSATTTALTSSLNPSIYGQKVTWTATVTTSGKTTPTGNVTFNWGSDSIGTAKLNSSGVATLTKSNLNADTYPLFAVYAGDANNGPSASPILNQVITQAISSATIASSPNPSIQGESVTFTATISSPTTTPTGPVTFTSGTTTLGTVELSKGKATLTTSTLPVGSNTVTVTYPWNSNIAESSASVTQVVQQ